MQGERIAERPPAMGVRPKSGSAAPLKGNFNHAEELSYFLPVITLFKAMHMVHAYLSSTQRTGKVS